MIEIAVVHFIDFVFYHAKDEFDSPEHRCRTIKLLFLAYFLGSEGKPTCLMKSSYEGILIACIFNYLFLDLSLVKIIIVFLFK